MRTLLFAFCLSLVTAKSYAQVIKTCDVGGMHRQRVEVLRYSKVASTYVYSIRKDGIVKPFFGGEDQSRGDPVSVHCVGKSQRALIVWGEFTANALQGFALVNAPDVALLERLDFAEKVPPSLIYLGQQEVLVVFSPMGSGEYDARYVLYRHVVGTIGKDQVDASELLPPSTGFEVIRLPQSKK